MVCSNSFISFPPVFFLFRTAACVFFSLENDINFSTHLMSMFFVSKANWVCSGKLNWHWAKTNNNFKYAFSPNALFSFGFKTLNMITTAFVSHNWYSIITCINKHISHTYFISQVFLQIMYNTHKIQFEFTQNVPCRPLKRLNKKKNATNLSKIDVNYSLAQVLSILFVYFSFLLWTITTMYK